MTLCCDHGVAITRYCGDCEYGLVFDAEPEDDRDLSRLAVVICVIAMVVIALLAAAAKAR